MSQLNSLLESANPYKSLQSDAARLADKWNKTGLLEGMSNETEKNNMSIILENQAKQLVTEASNTGGGAGAGSFTAGTGAQWAGVALPLVRKVFGQIAAKEFVSVQPMNLPSGLVFYLDFQYGTTKDPFTSGTSMYGDRGGNNPFGNTNTGGAYGAGRFGYSINNTGSVIANASLATGSADWYVDLNTDSDFSQSVVDGTVVKVTIALSQLDSNYDPEAIRAFRLSGSNAPTDAQQYPAFTRISGTDILFFADSGSIDPAADTALAYSLAPTDGERGDFEEGNTNLNGENNPITIPEINIQMESSAIVAKTRKLKAVSCVQ